MYCWYCYTVHVSVHSLKGTSVLPSTDADYAAPLTLQNKLYPQKGFFIIVYQLSKQKSHQKPQKNDPTKSILKGHKQLVRSHMKCPLTTSTFVAQLLCGP